MRRFFRTRRFSGEYQERFASHDFSRRAPEGTRQSLTHHGRARLASLPRGGRPHSRGPIRTRGRVSRRVVEGRGRTAERRRVGREYGRRSAVTGGRALRLGGVRGRGTRGGARTYFVKR